ncbi:UDP-N-acetylmuramate dehydrogenase [Facklamia sp. DSM 111018]|uniref:UDP-N-acetylenolpyruvoylglucosamine reductase n=1 Tax=Facklamia lactis TaxID=2749967 RepID=A0ABS0LSG3_9LACT|nr:UDP-N-acetylmuramate dehydrogenase [Facklamia lactis]MBG9986400.1 UDP-N-acetylmuramate dehydrogenase [Facklamia lactis]
MKDFNNTYPDIKCFENEPLSKYTFTKTGGKADLLVFPKSIQEVKEVIDWTNQSQMSLTVLGNASNLIVRDGGIRGVVMMLTDMKAIQLMEEELIEVQSGAGLIEVTHFALEHQLTGLEFACGIPGSIGGAVFMNAGAYGGEVKDVIQEVDVLTRDGVFKNYVNSACHFSYRHSVFQDNDEVILAVRFKLTKGDVQAIKQEMDRLTFLRESKQPLEYPSCGSVFKRPEGYYTGKLIQDAGLQGYRIGGAEVSQKHAGFIVNVDQATATDYTDLIAYIQQTIWNLNHVQLETEVKIIGEEA